MRTGGSTSISCLMLADKSRRIFKIPLWTTGCWRPDSLWIVDCGFEPNATIYNQACNRGLMPLSGLLEQ